MKYLGGKKLEVFLETSAEIQKTIILTVHGQIPAASVEEEAGHVRMAV